MLESDQSEVSSNSPKAPPSPPSNLSARAKDFSIDALILRRLDSNDSCARDQDSPETGPTAAPSGVLELGKLNEKSLSIGRLDQCLVTNSVSFGLELSPRMLNSESLRIICDYISKIMKSDKLCSLLLSDLKVRLKIRSRNKF